ncbi:hypothetical protein CNR22_15215 [Sphingobacteriaceae bacterium]|nr:hypothetical protein CNR22_15215 [Sphingobacteriaceae bacterium]
MKKSITLLALCIVFCIGKSSAQSFSPIALTGYNFDAVAEATTALATTSGPIDGSNYVLYSAAYGALYSSTYGLPNNGVITSGTYSYQLAPYTANNVCFTTATVTVDSLSLVTPAPYSGLSLLCFSTEGNGTMTVTVRFTDNTTQVFTNQSLSDWFQNNGVLILSDFDRVNRTGTTPSNGSGSKMFALNLPITCTNRSKNVKNVKFSNGGTPRNVILAISGAAMPSYTAVSTPVSCAGGIDGTASIYATGGTGPYTYTWSTASAQTGSMVSNLGVGTYSIISQDGGGSACALITTVSVTQSLVAQPSLSVSANFYTVCAGKSITLTTSGASTYTWSNAVNTSTQVVNPGTSATYTVGGYTSLNCYRTGSISIQVNPLPIITFTMPPTICLNAAALPLDAAPLNGNYSGTGVNTGTFFPNISGIGTKTVSYTVIDNNGCTSSVTNTIVVNGLPVVNFTLSPNSLCANSDTFVLTATPSNGTFTGLGVTGSVYTPSVAGVGTQTVTYAYTDANGCTVQKLSSVAIYGLPTPAFSTTKKTFCVNSATLYLNAQPIGGIYSGPGTSSVGVFSPTLAGAGNHTLVYSSTDLNGCVGKALYTVTVSTCSGIGEFNSNLSSVLVYPNPNNGAFTIKATSAIALKVINEIGQVVATLSLDEKNAYETSVSDLASGIYFIIGENQEQRIQQKVIIFK